MTPGWRISLVGTALIAVLAAGAYLNARLERADEADALEARVAELTRQAAETDRKAVALETELQAVRLAATEINRKWSDIRAKKDRAACQLDAATVGLLKSATGGDPR